MALEGELKRFVIRVATEFKAIRATQGDPATLKTAAKNSLVAAINELFDSVSGSAVIDDNVTGTGTAYSSQKIVDLIAALKTELVGGADSALDTFKELADKLLNNSDALTALLNQVSECIKYTAQSLTDAQKTQARDNIGAVAVADIGDTTFDYVNLFETSLT